MNCFNHPEEPAVSQCMDCQKGLCTSCSTMYSPHLCTVCYQARKQEEIKKGVLSLILYAVLFFFGYKLNFLGTDHEGNTRQWTSAYFLAAIYTGYKIFNRYIGWKATGGTLGFLVIFSMFKFIICVFIGYFTAPLVILGQVVCIVQAYRK